MKKKTIILFTLLMAVSLLVLTGCDKDTSVYGKTKMTDYVTLPDYEKYEVNPAEIKVTDEEVDAAIDARIAAASTETKEITEGTVEKGDSVNISFKGKLADGTTDPGMNSDKFPMKLGEANMIEGFQEGLYGATIGKKVTLNLKFPKPYMKKELEGKDVTFEVVVLNKVVPVEVKLDEKFIKKDSAGKAKTKEEYREFLKDTLTQQKTDSVKKEEQKRIYQEIAKNSKVEKLLDDEVKATKEKLVKRYEDAAKNKNMKFKDFIKNTLGWTPEQFDKEVAAFAETNVKESMIMYAIAQKEEVEITDKEYDAKLQEILSNTGFKTEEEFKKNVGVDLAEYGEMYGVRLNTMMEETMNKIYTRLIEGK